MIATLRMSSRRAKVRRQESQAARFVSRRGLLVFHAWTPRPSCDATSASSARCSAGRSSARRARSCRARRARPAADPRGPRRRRGAARRARAGHGAAARARVHHLLPSGQRRRAGAPRPRAGGATRRSDGTWLSQAVDRIAGGGRARAPSCWAELDRLAVRPVFTAHPTEAARRTVLAKIGQVAALLDERAHADGDPLAERGVRRRLEELIDLLWQTDELRIARPDVVDEARNAVYYFDALHRDARPGRARGARERARRGSASSCRSTLARSPSAAGSAATATATRTSAPRAPSRCSRSSTSTPSAARWRWSTSCARPLHLGAHRRRHAGARGLARRATSRRCPSSSRATGA